MMRMMNGDDDTDDHVDNDKPFLMCQSRNYYIYYRERA